MVTTATNKHRSTWQTAVECQLHADKGLRPAEIAERTHQTRSNVYNHLRCLRQLAPAILAEWERGHPAASVDFLRRIVIKPHDQQLESWAARVADSLVVVRSPDKRAIERARALINLSDEGEEWRRGAADALDFVLGRTDGLGPYQRSPRRASRAARQKGSTNVPDDSRGHAAA